MKDSPYVSTTNACKLCTPLGAALAFKGIEGCVPFLHGSQGCATYMRRYIISHYREPMDIASSALGEKQAVFGGGPNLKKGLLNVMQKYHASVIGVASTCLTETIGDDLGMILDEFRREFGDLDLCDLVQVSTPSYSGTHMEGWHHAMRAVAEQLVKEESPANGTINIMPGFVSPADIRHLKELCMYFDQPATILPDISETLDAPALEDYEILPSGGTPVAAIKAMGGSRGSIEFGRTLEHMKTAGDVLEAKFKVPNHKIGMPIGIRETDTFLETMEELSGKEIPKHLTLERGRLVDAMVDGHKYVSGKRAVVYGEEDLVIGLCAMLAEIGVQPVLAGTGSKSSTFAKCIEDVTKGLVREMPVIRTGADFHDMAEEAGSLSPDMLIGHSKGYRYAKKWNIPLVRVGFPIHDRFGGTRIQLLGYRGTQSLYDRIVNAVLTKKQADNPVGYGYL